MTDIAPVGFFIFGGIAIACALMVVFKKNPVSSAFSLVLMFAAFAGIYAMLGAHFIAALQILVYAGAIMVLFIFVIMLLNADEPSFDLVRSHPILRGVVGFFCLTLLGFFVWAFKNSESTVSSVGPYTTAAVANSGGNAKVISELMFSKYLLPFELTSVLLLGGIIGAVALAKRNTPRAKAGSI